MMIGGRPRRAWARYGAMRTGATGLFAVALLLAGCAGGQGGPGRTGLETAVAAYYEDHASEERGVCLHPYMEGITAVQTVEDAAERRVVRVRYFYRDWFKSERENA